MTRAVGKIVDDKEDLEEVEALYGPVAREAVTRFPVDAKDVKLVTHSENITFRVKTPGDQTDYVLRLHRPGYSSIEEMESERLWTHALKETGVLVQDDERLRRAPAAPAPTDESAEPAPPHQGSA